MFGVRFNGSSLKVFKYRIVSDDSGVLELENITPGVSRLSTHRNDRVSEDRIGRVHEQYNAYVVYVRELGDVKDAAVTLYDKLTADKQAYIKASELRINELDAQAGIINNTDIDSLIAGMKADDAV